MICFRCVEWMLAVLRCWRMDKKKICHRCLGRARIDWKLWLSVIWWFGLSCSSLDNPCGYGSLDPVQFGDPTGLFSVVVPQYIEWLQSQGARRLSCQQKDMLMDHRNCAAMAQEAYENCMRGTSQFVGTAIGAFAGAGGTAAVWIICSPSGPPGWVAGIAISTIGYIGGYIGYRKDLAADEKYCRKQSQNAYEDRMKKLGYPFPLRHETP